MNDKTTISIHWSFWLIVVIALIWNVMGVINFVFQMDADAVAKFPETHRAIIEGRPEWATGGFAVAVFGGALGCILLLFRKSAAYYLFIASLIGVIVTMVHTVGVAGSAIEFSVFKILIMILMPLVVATFLLWYSRRVASKGWIKQEQSAGNQ